MLANWNGGYGRANGTIPQQKGYHTISLLKHRNGGCGTGYANARHLTPRTRSPSTLVSFLVNVDTQTEEMTLHLLNTCVSDLFILIGITPFPASCIPSAHTRDRANSI